MIAARDAATALDDRELAGFTGWRVELPHFEGPIDLLVYLVQRGQVDPLELELAQITARYLEEMMQQGGCAAKLSSDGVAELEAVGEFLLAAATLLELKSRALLPIEKVEAVEEEGPGPLELAARAMEYELFRQASQELRLRAQRQELVFLRAPDGDGDEADWELASQVSAEQLWLQFRRVLERAQGGPVMRVERLVLTVHQQMNRLLRLLSTAGDNGVGLEEVFEGAPTRIELIVTFLALLELVRLKRARIMQQLAFGPIRVLRRPASAAQLS
jgi:segregation and condensation protein A